MISGCVAKVGYVGNPITASTAAPGYYAANGMDNDPITGMSSAVLQL